MKTAKKCPMGAWKTGAACLIGLLWTIGSAPGGALAAGRPAPAAAEASFRDDFDSPSLDPAWEVVEFTGTRVNGYTSPANHYSLTDTPGSLRYALDEMTHGSGYLNGYQIYVNTYPYDWGLELHREIEGDDWVFETQATYYMPYTNGRGLITRIYFGDGGPGTYLATFYRWRDMDFNSAWFSIQVQTGTTAESVENVASAEISSSPADAYFYRLSRSGGILSASWSVDGSDWNPLLTHDLGPALDGLEQRIVLTGECWFNTAGSYVDYDYVSLTPAASAASLVADASGAAEVYPGDTVAVDLNIEDADGLYAAQAECSVDPAVLQPQSAAFGGFFDPVDFLVGANSADPGNGTWIGAISQRNPAGPLSGGGLFATITFQAADPGTTELVCEPVFADRDGFPLPVEYVGASVTVLPFASVGGTLNLQGRTDHAGITITAVGPVTRTAVTDSGGSFSLDLKAGTYTITAEAAGYLPIGTTVTVASGDTVIMNTATLYGGNLNGDDVIDIGDAALLGANFGLSVPPGDPAADINGDGRVDVLDLALLAGNYGMSGTQPW